jgi:hypothetical protein
MAATMSAWKGAPAMWVYASSIITTLPAVGGDRPTDLELLQGSNFSQFDQESDSAARTG